MNGPHDVHLIYNNQERAQIVAIRDGLRDRGLIPWFWDDDAPADWENEERASITTRTPACAVFLGAAGWGENYHLPFARLAYESARPVIPVLLPGWRSSDLGRLGPIFERRWIELQTPDDRRPLDQLAQRIVEAAYETPAYRLSSARGGRAGGSAGRRLVVYVPARSQTVESWRSLRSRLESEPELRDCLWYGHDYHADVWSRDSLEAFAVDLSARIAARINEADQASPEAPVARITLLGHSLGGVLARVAYLMAAGQYPEHLHNRSPWWSLVDRIALFASPNRGIEARRFGWRDRAAIKWPFGGRGRLTRDQLVGSVAITNLRIRWIRFFAELDPANRPTMIQFLARGDRWVKREDSLDIQQFPDAWQRDVPGATHTDLHQVSDADPDRYAILRQGILEAKPVDEPQEGSTEPRRNPVVIILHGIRANNETWAEQVRKEIERRAPNAAAVAPTYRYFPMLDFAMPWLRARKIRLLQDQYSGLLARHPRARFCFIGHSNGTYILGHTLRRVPGMRFHRLTLAGSVLPRDYDWETRLGQGQVREISNHRSSRDWAVAILCNLLRALGMKDVGTAGFDGFEQRMERIKEVYYYDGGHSRPLHEDNLPKLVDYTLSGRVDFPMARDTRPPGQFLSRLSGSKLVGFGALAGVGALLIGSIWALFRALAAWTPLAEGTAWAIAASVVVVVAYLFSRYY